MFETVLCPVDQSRQAFETIRKAIQLAKSHQSHIILLSVVQAKNNEMNNAQLIISLLKKAQEQIRQAGLTCDVLNKQGKPAFVICDVADDLNVDLIVIGTKGINLEEDIESTAARVIQLAPCPVLVVP